MSYPISDIRHLNQDRFRASNWGEERITRRIEMLRCPFDGCIRMPSQELGTPYKAIERCLKGEMFRRQQRWRHSCCRFCATQIA